MKMELCQMKNALFFIKKVHVRMEPAGLEQDAMKELMIIRANSSTLAGLALRWLLIRGLHPRLLKLKPFGLLKESIIAITKPERV